MNHRLYLITLDLWQKVDRDGPRFVSSDLFRFIGSERVPCLLSLMFQKQELTFIYLLLPSCRRRPRSLDLQQ
jgi:hypothetical protein